MLEWFWELSGANVYYQHSICLTNDPLIMMLYVAGDMATFMSYMIIGGSLFWYRIKTMRFSTQALNLYGAFIVLCGLSHLTKTLTLFTGIYRIDILVVMAMASVSVVTALRTLLDTYDYAAEAGEDR